MKNLFKILIIVGLSTSCLIASDDKQEVKKSKTHKTFKVGDGYMTMDEAKAMFADPNYKVPFRLEHEFNELTGKFERILIPIKYKDEEKK